MKTKEESISKGFILREHLKDAYIDNQKIRYSIYNAMQEFSDQNTKPLINEIAEFKRRIIYWNELHNEVIKENAKLQSDLKAADSVNEWISVEDRLPEQNGMYLVFTDYGNVATIRSFSVELGFLDVHVTHWMPLAIKPI